MNYKQLSTEERETIFLCLEGGKSIRDAAKEIKRNHTTVSREVSRNKGPDGHYRPFVAQDESVKRKSQANSRNPRKDPRIMKHVEDKLSLNWSPDQISGRMKLLEIPGFSISKETIYQHVYNKDNKSLSLWVYLRRCKSRRSSWHERKPQKEMIQNRVFIGERPEYINNRLDYGHWETDLVIGARTAKDAISVTVERKARYTLLGKVATASSEEKTRATVSSMSNLPPWLRKSMTLDNGPENAGHENIGRMLKLAMYFCNPYSSWERGTVENTNGLLRQYFPKKTSFEGVTQRDLNLVAQLLNNRPRKILGYETPSEVFFRELNGAVRSRP